MKKNLATVILLALTVVNLAMNCIIVFTLVPANQKVNTLITQIAGAIDLELSDETAANYDSSSPGNVSLEDIDTYTIEDDLTINLAKGEGDSDDHVAVISVAINQNMKSEAYEQYGGSDNMAARESNIKSTIVAVVGSFTYDEMMSDKTAAPKACAEALNELFGSTDFIVSVDFPSAIYQ